MATNDLLSRLEKIVDAYQGVSDQGGMRGRVVVISAEDMALVHQASPQMDMTTMEKVSPQNRLEPVYQAPMLVILPDNRRGEVDGKITPIDELYKVVG